MSGGSITSQVPAIALGHRGWKRQPSGGLIGFGTSPSRSIGLRFRPSSGFGIGTAESSAPVYG